MAKFSSDAPQYRIGQIVTLRSGTRHKIHEVFEYKPDRGFRYLTLTVRANGKTYGPCRNITDATPTREGEVREVASSVDAYEIQIMPDDMLIHNIKCAENVLGNPKQFPKANIFALEERWKMMVAEAVGRALIGVTQGGEG